MTDEKAYQSFVVLPSSIVPRPSRFVLCEFCERSNSLCDRDIARVMVYLSGEAPEGAKWYKYDVISGWQDYSDHAVFGQDRKTVTLELKDGGFGDGDGTENGIIIDPSGLGTASYSDQAATTSSESGGGSGGGCFIATAAYGSLFEPHVRLLRQFRDRFLLTNPVGKTFVRLYYEYSPSMAKFISGHESLRMIVRWSLLPLVGMSWSLLRFGLLPTTLFLLLISALISVNLILGSSACPAGPEDRTGESLWRN